MKVQRNENRPLSDTIKLMDSGGNIREVKLVDLEPCLLERFILGVKLPQNVVLENNAASRYMISRMASMMVFKIVE